MVDQPVRGDEVPALCKPQFAIASIGTGSRWITESNLQVFSRGKVLFWTGEPNRLSRVLMAGADGLSITLMHGCADSVQQI